MQEFYASFFNNSAVSCFSLFLCNVGTTHSCILCSDEEIRPQYHKERNIFMTYCGSSLYRNNSCGTVSRNSGAGCVCDNNGNCSCSNGISGCGNSGSCGCGNSNTCGCGTNIPICNLPPRPSCHGTCPAGTFPCHPPYPPFYPYCPCMNSGNCGCGGNGNGNFPPAQSGTFAFLNSSGTTISTGSIIPLRYVLGTGNLAKNTSGGSINLDSGIYNGIYSVSGVAPGAGTTITVTPEYGGMLHPEYSRSYTSTTAGDSFEISGLIAMNPAADTTLSLNVTIVGDATAETTLTGVNASMIINKVCDITG